MEEAQAFVTNGSSFDFFAFLSPISESVSKKSLDICIQSAGQAFVGGHADQADVIDFLGFTKEGMNCLGRSVRKVTD